MNLSFAPYIHFVDNTREAMEFYNSVIAGDLNVTTFGEMGLGDETIAKLVMHSQIELDGRPVLMAADTPPGSTPADGTRLSVAVFADDGPAVREWFSALAKEGEVDMPLAPAPWGDSYGQLTDKYGVLWLMNLSAAARD